MANEKTNRRRSGFSAFDLALTLASAVLVIQIIPQVMTIRAASATPQCIAHLRDIDSAKAAWARDHAKGANAVPADEDLIGPTRYLKVKPTCPQGGTYQMGKIGEKPTCSHPGHTL